MKRSLLAFSLALALGSTNAVAADTSAPVAAAPVAAASAGDSDQTDQAPQPSRNRIVPRSTTQMGTIDVTAKLDQARNALSPDIGASQYVIDEKAIAALPLGDSTPLNQVLLQAPGVVQDSYGQIHVRGDHDNLQYRIDGVMIPESISGFGQTLDTQVIKNIKLTDGALPAQFGERTAAVVDITTKNNMGNGGSVGVTGGQFGTFNPNVSLWGSSNRWSYFFTANYLQDDVGIENPTSSRSPIHDHTNQLHLFGDLSYLINDDTRLTFMYGAADNRFQIPNNPNQTPQYSYLGQTQFNSADLNERQNENTRFGVISLQGKLGDTSYQVSAEQRVSSVDYYPDQIGDLMFNGVAGQIGRTDRANQLMVDFATPLGDSHTLRYGLYGELDYGYSSNNSEVFPADVQETPDGPTYTQTSTTPISIYQNNRFETKTYAGYVQDEWNIGDNWTLNYGVRGDIYKAFGTTASQLSPRFGVVWQATPSTTVHAGYSRYFTPPATELISTTNITAFNGTTNQQPSNGNNVPLPERSNYYDIGISQNIGNWTLGFDSYYREVHDLQDEGQFGAALIYSTFNYAKGRVNGDEFSLSYDNGPISAYFNFTYSKAMGKDVVTSQYNFSPADLAYIANNYIYLDHDQKFTSSGGITYAINGTTKVGANYLFGTGLREDGLVPNGLSLPSYFQLNLDVSHDFDFPQFGKLHTQLAVINALDRSYQIRSGTGVGVESPQWGPRRGVFLNLRKDFNF